MAKHDRLAITAELENHVPGWMDGWVEKPFEGLLAAIKKPMHIFKTIDVSHVFIAIHSRLCSKKMNKLTFLLLYYFIYFRV